MRQQDLFARLDPPPTLQESRSLTFVRHPRARRYVIRVVDDGTVRVTLPRWGSKRDAQAFVDRERQWIDGHLRRLESDRARHESERRTGRDGSQDRHDDDGDGALRERAKRELPLRLLELAVQHRLRVSKISVRDQKWRWGSCSPAGHICLNWRLVRMPDSVRDYVLIHELMHLKRLDHSKKFWKLVAEACPDYRALRQELRHTPRQ